MVTAGEHKEKLTYLYDGGESKKNMNTWKEYIEELKNEWIGKKVVFEGAIYTVVDVDYNGVLMINKKGEHTETTAAFTPAHAVMMTEENGSITDSCL